MKWQVVKTNSGYHAQYGGCAEQQEASFRIGFIMPGFIVQESARFDTEQEANEYIERKKQERN